jgi:hypothetical protein
MKSMLEELIGTIGKFTYLSKYGHFIIVPGPNDIAMTTVQNHHILPLPSFPKSMIHGLQKNVGGGNVVANLHFTSNPCRIRFTHSHYCHDHQHDDHTITTTNKEMVIFRYDLLQLFQQHQIRLRAPCLVSSQQDATTTMPVDGEKNEDIIPNAVSVSSSLSHNRRLLYKTILDQGCLIPISNVPTYWSYSHYLSLYPLPSCLVLADGSISHHPTTTNGGCTEQYDSHHDCDIIQTISFSNNFNDSSSSTKPNTINTSSNNNGAHTIYRPNSTTTTRQKEMDDDENNDDDTSNDHDSDTSERIVEFARVG